MTSEERKTRDWILKNFRDDNEINWKDPNKFKRTINLPSTLKIIEWPPQNNSYNCFVFAFGLSKDKSFNNYNLLGDGIYIQKLIDKNVLKFSLKPKVNDYIIYKNRGNVTHAGIVKDNNKVVSKWGFGPVIKHSI